MKQHITPKQLNEITEEQFYNLFDEIVKRKDWAKYHHKKMTIGKMIEVLTNNSITVDIKITSMDTEDGNNGFVVINNVFYGKAYKSKELCDALWDAVKDVVKENDNN